RRHVERSQGDVARHLRRSLARLAPPRGRGARDRPPPHRRGGPAAPPAAPRGRRRAAHGDMAVLAKEAKLVATLAPRDEVRKRLIALTGEDKEKHSFKQIGYGDYRKSKGGARTGATGRGTAVAVVVAKGTILDGTQPAGTIGG